MAKIYYESELTHHGTKGQKWGQRLYQNPDGSLTPLGRIRYGVKSAQRKRNLKKARAVKAEKKRIADEEAKKQQQIEAAKKAHEEAKKKAVESGTADEVYKYRGELTKEEIDKAVNRITSETKLYELTTTHKAAVEAGKQQTQQVVTQHAETKVSMLDKFESAANTAKRVSTAVEKGIDLWNTAAKINNTFNDKKMTVINGNKSNNNKKKKEEKK